MFTPTSNVEREKERERARARERKREREKERERERERERLRQKERVVVRRLQCLLIVVIQRRSKARKMGRVSFLFSNQQYTFGFR